MDWSNEVDSPGEPSRRYIECHNDYDLDGLMGLVDEFVDFKRASDQPLSGAEAVRRQYRKDWAGHDQVVVTVKRIFESGSSAAVEIHVESGPPSNVRYDGVVVHNWNREGHLIKYRLYVDEVLPSADPGGA
jgi:hypothetical protein